MLLPALLPQQFSCYRLAKTPEELLKALTSAPSDLLTFFVAACEDLTWSENNPKLLKEFISWLTKQHMASTLPTTYFQEAAAAIRAHYEDLREIIPQNLALIISENSFPTNTLLLATSASFFSSLIHRQCRIGKKTSIPLNNDKLTPRLFSFVLEYVHTEAVELLWREEAEQILALHDLADSWNLEGLQQLCVEIYKRYLTEENVLKTLLQAHRKGWKAMRLQCMDFISSTDMGIYFVPGPIESLFFAFSQCHDKSRNLFLEAANAITHLICRGEIALHPFMSEAVGRCPLLRGIDIAASEEYPELLELLPGDLSYLNISESPWLDKDTFRALAISYPNVEKLILHRCNTISNGSWGILSRWALLRSLDISDCYRITDEELHLILKACPNIEELTLHNCKELSDAGLKPLSKQATIQRLNLARTVVENETVIELAFRCHNLQQLDISYCEKISERAIWEVVKHGRALHKLVIHHCNLPIKVLAELQQRYPRLQIIS